MIFKDLQGRNCNGERPLDKLKLEIIQETVYKVYSVTSNHRSDVWRKCVVAIDEYLRYRSTTCI